MPCRRTLDSAGRGAGAHTELAPLASYDSAGVWIDSRGEPCLVLRARFPSGACSPRLLHERTCMAAARPAGEVGPHAPGGDASHGPWVMHALQASAADAENGDLRK